MAEKIALPTETISLPSKGKVYDTLNPLSSGEIEMKYMTAREEDILTNPNLLRQGLAIEKVLQALIQSPIQYDDLLLGDRNALLIAARILGYGSSYSFEYVNPETETKEQITIDLQQIKDKAVDETLFKNKNEFVFELPFSKNVVSIKLLTVADEKKIDQELKGLKKANLQTGELTLRLKHQITSINGDYSVKAVRDFIDTMLLARDSNALRSFITSITPDIDLTVDFKLADGTEVSDTLPLTAEFFFPRN
jgi:hypothetical protein